jgi:hypothetical protein
MDAAELKATSAALIAAILDIRTLITRRPFHELLLLKEDVLAVIALMSASLPKLARTATTRQSTPQCIWERFWLLRRALVYRQPPRRLRVFWA